MRILMVEDERYMAEAVEHILKKNNYTVDLAFDGEYGFDSALTGIYDCIILDIMLPKMDGITVLKRLRENDIFTPVILLTAKTDVEDKIIGLDSGADDYLSKPFSTEELLARLRALIRRKGELKLDNIITFGDIELNPHLLMLTVNKKSFKLTLKESQVLEVLIGSKNRCVAKEIIIEKLWGYDKDAEENTVEVYISFLRKKLSSLESIVHIKTIRGVGYILSIDNEE